jgi:PAS domain S-box-containing protein
MHELDRLVDKRTSELSEANLRLSLLAAALKAAANSISITDSKGTVVWTNPAFSALSGYSAEEALGTNRRVLKSGVHEDKFYKEMWAAISSGKTWRGEVINRRKDGSLTPEEMTITPVALQAVDITHFIEINQDISERKQAEQSLLDAEEKYRAIFEDAVVGIFQATPDGRLLDSNRAFATMLGYESPEQLLADESRNSLSHVMNASHRNEWISILEKQGVIRSTELEVPCKDGTRKWVLVNARAVRNLDGVVVKHEGTVEGITDRKAAQMQIKFLAYYDALT